MRVLSLKFSFLLPPYFEPLKFSMVSHREYWSLFLVPANSRQLFVVHDFVCFICYSIRFFPCCS